MDDQQATPGEYAEDKVELTADNLVHNTANVAVFGIKLVVRQERKLSQRQRKKKATEKRRDNTTPTEQHPAPEPSPGATPEGQLPQRHDGMPTEGWLSRQLTDSPRDVNSPGRTPPPPRTGCFHASEPARPRNASGPPVYTEFITK